MFGHRTRGARRWLTGLAIAMLAIAFAGAAPPPPRVPGGSTPASPTPTRTPLASPLLQTVAARHQSTLGVYVHHLGRGDLLQMNADEVFRSASLYKLFVLYDVYARLANGTMRGDEMLTMTQQALINEPYAEWGLGTRTTVDCALTAMVTISSNAAAAMLLERIGGEPVLTANMHARGYNATEITVDRAYTSPRDVGRLLEAIATDQAVSPAASAAMRHLLLEQRHNDRIPLPLPSSVAVGHKTGELTKLRHDAGIVYGRSGSYVIVAMSDRAPSDAEARSAVLDLSREVYNRFEPGTLSSYLGLPPRLAQEVFRLPDAQGRLDALDDPGAMTVAVSSIGVSVGNGSERSAVRDVVLPDLLALQRAASQASAPFWVTEGYRDPPETDWSHMVHVPIMPIGCTVTVPPPPDLSPENLAADGSPSPPPSPAEGEISSTPSSPAGEGGGEGASSTNTADQDGTTKPPVPSLPAPSQHWLGTVVAVSDAPDRDSAATGAEPSATARWLAANAWQYGFILALPETELGARLGYEPWRLRWVGREMAARLKDAAASPATYQATIRTALLQAEADLSQ